MSNKAKKQRPGFLRGGSYVRVDLYERRLIALEEQVREFVTRGVPRHDAKIDRLFSAVRVLERHILPTVEWRCEDCGHPQSTPARIIRESVSGVRCENPKCGNLQRDDFMNLLKARAATAYHGYKGGPYTQKEDGRIESFNAAVDGLARTLMGDSEKEESRG